MNNLLRFHFTVTREDGRYLAEGDVHSTHVVTYADSFEALQANVVEATEAARGFDGPFEFALYEGGNETLATSADVKAAA